MEQKYPEIAHLWGHMGHAVTDGVYRVDEPFEMRLTKPDKDDFGVAVAAMPSNGKRNADLAFNTSKVLYFTLSSRNWDNFKQYICKMDKDLAIATYSFDKDIEEQGTVGWLD